MLLRHSIVPTEGNAMQTMTLTAKFGWGLMTAGVLLLFLFSLRYFLAGDAAYFPRQLETYKAHEVGLLIHIGAMMIAVLLGPFQFLRSFRNKHRAVHRAMGRVYLMAGTIGALGGLYMSFFSANGAITGVSFFLLGAGVLLTNTQGFRAIKGGNVQTHREWMTRSFALLLAAVTLRIYAAPLEMAFGEDTGYIIVAWACWVPNILVAEWVIRRQRQTGREPKRSAMGMASATGPAA